MSIFRVLKKIPAQHHKHLTNNINRVYHYYQNQHANGKYNPLLHNLSLKNNYGNSLLKHHYHIMDIK